MTDSAYRYLSSIQGDFARWNVVENALDLEDGSGTFAFADEIAEFLEGFCSQRRPIHFGLLMHLLQLLRRSLLRRAPLPQELNDPRRGRLWRLFDAHGKSPRHAGAFCALLCRAVPDAAGVDVAKVVDHLRRRDMIVHWYSFSSGTSEKPPWLPEEFKTRVLQELDALSDSEIRCWLEHGRWPVDDAARDLARELPVSLLGRLASLLDRPRLRGTKAFIPQLSGALTLPPRRLTYQDLPLGGYSDVTNRGNVDQLLLSQYALEEADFVRRFVEHELLFYRKEDPNHSTRQELVVLLDQGVRTWGDIRLVLGAALLALGKQADQRHMSFYLATTGSAGWKERREDGFEDDASPLIDPLAVSEAELAAIVEGSDLSANPGLALEGVLEGVARCPRDVVLLTHPRNLAEPDVRAAAKRTRPDMRLFALSLDRHGSALLHEMKHGTAVAIRQFHVDFSKASSIEEDGRIEPSVGQPGGWQGDVEPLGFPFRFGIDGKVGSFDFDVESRHMLSSCRQGLLHLWEVGGGLLEILPRAWHQKKPVAEVDAVVGVQGGFVVVGRAGQRFLAIHYDLGKRRCRIHALDESSPSQPAYATFGYSAAHHCFIAQRQATPAGDSIDLASGERFVARTGGDPSRAKDAWQAWERYQVPRRHLVVDFSFAPFVLLSKKEPGKIVVSRVDPAWEFVPLADGKPLLAGAKISEAQLGGSHLALRITSTTSSMFHSLQILHQSGAVVKSVQSSGERFRLSADGQLLARQLGNGGIQYGRVDRDAGTCQTLVGGFAQRLRFVLGDRELALFPGARQHTHHLGWQSGCLVIITTDSSRRTPSVDQGNSDESSSTMTPFGDAKRWTAWRKSAQGLLAVADCYGQIVVFDRQMRLVCMFIAFRNRLAGWMPDGTCFGPAYMTGKPADAGAMEKFGRALLAAEK